MMVMILISNFHKANMLHALHIINNELMNANQSCRIDLSTSFICGGFAEF